MIFRFLPVWLMALATLGAAAATNTLSDAEVQGRALARQVIQQQWPATNLDQTGVLDIRITREKRLELPIRIQVELTDSGWRQVYETSAPEHAARLVVIHNAGQPNRFELSQGTGAPKALTGSETMVPFAGSDFWVADLGLEFLHWPQQKLLKKVFRNGRACSVLESTNPNPPPNGYSRVVSWIDTESGGILQAEAYDDQGDLLKEYETKKFKKVNGQWQVDELEIDNDQADTSTKLEFNLGKH